MTSTQIPEVGATVTFSYPRWGARFGTVEAVQAHPSFAEVVVYVRGDDGQRVAWRPSHLREV